MFEGKLPRPAEAHALENGPDGDVLRELSWSDLVARLAASRDLRASFAGVATPADASFDADSARRIAAHHNGKPAVNLEASSYRKGPRGTAAPAVHDAPVGVARD